MVRKLWASLSLAEKAEVFFFWLDFFLPSNSYVDKRIHSFSLDVDSGLLPLTPSATRRDSGARLDIGIPRGDRADVVDWPTKKSALFHGLGCDASSCSHGCGCGCRCYEEAKAPWACVL